MSDLFINYEQWIGGPCVPILSADKVKIFNLKQKDAFFVELVDHNKSSHFTVSETFISSVTGQAVVDFPYDCLLDLYIPSLPFVAGAATIDFEFRQIAPSVMLRFFVSEKNAVVSKPPTVINDGRCPKCGHPGEFRQMALCCPTHGAYAGI